MVAAATLLASAAYADCQPDPAAAGQVGGTSGIMIGSIIQSLFGKANNMPLGAAVSIVMMLVVTAIVCLFLWSVGYRKMKARGA